MVEVITSGSPVARKSHECDFCYRTIAAGERYDRQFNKFDGRVYVWKSCHHCLAMIHECGIEDWSGEGIAWENFADFDPANIFEARCLIMWRRKWRRKDGTLYDIPKRSTAA